MRGACAKICARGLILSAGAIDVGTAGARGFAYKTYVLETMHCY